jgi:hypothetical protein
MACLRLLSITLVVVGTACASERGIGPVSGRPSRPLNDVTVQPEPGGPLIVIDGVRLAAGELRRVSPSDIAAIEVVKGARAREIYGESGRHGVVLVTTRHPTPR